ncbi:hypothetical protein ID866_7780 [Astraeus odoratus]|nr:hypothetical protein ID866_7780 [Astraeus odoratus]
MRRTPVASIQDLPQEILLIICVYLHITDLFALSQVSRFFWLLLRDDLLWRNLYRSTRILRPPGPFRQQSTDFLRRALICSAKIGANWPPVKALPEFRRMVTVPMVDPAEYCHILAGRWLIAANASIACYYDLWEKPQPLPNLFYRPHLVAKFFRCVSTLNVNGDPLTFVVTETQVGIKMRRVNVGRISIDVNGPFVEPLLHYDLTQNHPGVSDVAIGARLLVIKPKGNICRIQPMIYDFRLLRPCKLAALPSNYQHVSTV